MASVKMTFSLDETTANTLNLTAERLKLAKSQVVREAILDYAARAGRLSEKERQHMLRAFDDHVCEIPERPVKEVDQELEEIRRARQEGGRGGSIETHRP